MKKKQPKYPNLPLYIVQIGKGFYNSKNGKWLSPQQLGAFSSKEVKLESKQHKEQEHWINKYYGN